jgi:hypothetical protein
LRQSDACRISLEEDGTYPSSLPLTLNSIKEVIRLDAAVTDEDDFLTSQILSAERVLNAHTGLYLRQHQRKATLTCLPITHRAATGNISYLSFSHNPLLEKPVIEVDGVEVDESLISIFTYNRKSFVLVEDIDDLNATIESTDSLAAVTLTAQVGLAATPSGDDPWLIPPEAITAIQRLVAFSYQNREGFDRGRSADDNMYLVLNELTTTMGLIFY